jgi:hypothetical protein
MGTRDLPTRRHAQVSRPALCEALLHVRYLPEKSNGTAGDPIFPAREP